MTGEENKNRRTDYQIIDTPGGGQALYWTGDPGWRFRAWPQGTLSQPGSGPFPEQRLISPHWE